MIQRREFDFAMNRATHGDVYFRSDYVRDGLDWVIVDGDTELAPGLTGLATFGHTPGHMSFSVEFPDRTIVLACDAADLEANIAGGSAAVRSPRPATKMPHNGRSSGSHNWRLTRTPRCGPGMTLTSGRRDNSRPASTHEADAPRNPREAARLDTVGSSTRGIRVAGITAAVELAAAILSIPGVDGVAVTGGARLGDEVDYCRALAAVADDLGGGRRISS